LGGKRKRFPTAITNGELDNGRHPNVGIYFYTFDETDVWIPHCTGVLIAPDVLLTAAHCVCGPAQYLQDNPAMHAWVTFDSDVTAVHSGCTSPAACPDAMEVPAGNIHIHPGFACEHKNSFGASDESRVADLAVIVLPRPVDGVTPASLPALGLLESLQAQNGLQGQTFTVVGYGWQNEFDKDWPFAFWWDGKRRLATSEYLALTPGFLLMSQNSELGNGGACLRDSGGPYFIGDSNMVVAVVHFVDDAPCRAMARAFRLDIELARGFLANHVTLP
jgi:hypothetical protein